MKCHLIATAVAIVVLPTSAAVGQGPPTSPTVQRDQSAISAIEQTLGAAGNIQTLEAIHGITGSGTITLKAGEGLQGTVTIRRQDGRRFRSDIIFPNGVRTAIADGGSEVVRDEQGFVRSHATVGAAANELYIFPYTQLLMALADPGMSVADLGVVTHQGQTVHEVRTQKIYLDGSDPQGYKAALSTRDYLLAPNSFQILSILDTPTARSIAQGPLALTHELKFSGYQLISGILIPFSSTEIMNNQELSNVTFQNVVLNAQFNDADFTF